MKKYAAFYYVIGSIFECRFDSIVYLFRLHCLNIDITCLYVQISVIYVKISVFHMIRPFIICSLHLDRWLSDFEFVNLPNYSLKTFALQFLNSKLKPLTCKKSFFIFNNKMWNLHQVEPGFVCFWGSGFLSSTWTRALPSRNIVFRAVTNENIENYDYKELASWAELH